MQVSNFHTLKTNSMDIYFNAMSGFIIANFKICPDNGSPTLFMPKDDAINASDGEMEEIDHELEEFKRFCLMTKPLENRPRLL